MRISTNQIYNNGINSILDQQAKLVATQQQMSTGKKVLTGADDPAAMASSLNINQSLKIVGQYQDNINVATSRQNLEDQTMGSATDILNSIRALAIQGNTASTSSQDKASLANQINEDLDQLVSLANTRDANGEYLFAGYQGTTQPFTVDASGNYTYSGDNGQRFLQIGQNKQIAVSDSGADVFQAIRNGNGTFTTLDNPANSGTGVIDPGSVTNKSAYDGDTYSVKFPVPTAATGTLTFNDGIGTNDNLTYTLKINGTTVYTTSENGTPVSSLDDLAANINDDATVTGVKAYVVNGALYLGHTSPSTDPITVTEGLTGASDGDADTATGYFGSALTGTTTASVDTTYDSADAVAYVVEDSSGNIETSGAYADGGQITFNGIATAVTGTPQTGDEFTISPSANQDMFTTIKNLAAALENSSSTADGVAKLANATNRALGDIDQSMNNIEQVRSKIGSRLNVLDTQQNLNDSFSLQLQTSLSQLEDLDITDAAIRLQQQTVGLQAAQQSFVKIQGLSLFNYL